MQRHGHDQVMTIDFDSVTLNIILYLIYPVLSKSFTFTFNVWTQMLGPYVQKVLGLNALYKGI